MPSMPLEAILVSITLVVGYASHGFKVDRDWNLTLRTWSVSSFTVLFIEFSTSQFGASRLEWAKETRHHVQKKSKKVVTIRFQVPKRGTCRSPDAGYKLDHDGMCVYANVWRITGRALVGHVGPSPSWVGLWMADEALASGVEHNSFLICLPTAWIIFWVTRSTRQNQEVFLFKPNLCEDTFCSEVRISQGSPSSTCFA